MVAPSAAAIYLLKINMQFPVDASAGEQIALRWMHFASGIMWVGLLYFFNLVATPVMAKCEPQLRSRVYAELVPKAMWWMRWSAVVAWLAGFRYFMILAKTDAVNAGNRHLMWQWIGIWFACWVVTFAILMGLLQAGSASPTKSGIGNGWVLGVIATVVVIAASWIVLKLIAGPDTSNRTLCISIGGGLGTIMFLSVWGIVWRCQKKLIAWHTASVQNGTPMPPEAAKIARLSFLTARLNFWISFPMLFFMAASSHFPFLSGQ